MKTYTLAVPVEKASGHQYYEVTAKSEKEAIALFNQGCGELINEEIEVTELGEPEIVEEK